MVGKIKSDWKIKQWLIGYLNHKEESQGSKHVRQQRDAPSTWSKQSGLASLKIASDWLTKSTICPIHHSSVEYCHLQTGMTPSHMGTHQYPENRVIPSVIDRESEGYIASFLILVVNGHRLKRTVLNKGTF